MLQRSTTGRLERVSCVLVLQERSCGTSNQTSGGAQGHISGDEDRPLAWQGLRHS